MGVEWSGVGESLSFTGSHSDYLGSIFRLKKSVLEITFSHSTSAVLIRRIVPRNCFGTSCAVSTDLTRQDIGI